MAALAPNTAKLTLKSCVRHNFLFNRIQRSISTSHANYGCIWFIREKQSRLKVLYTAPKKEKASNQDGNTEIVIPDRIERSPTAILEALASTVKNHINQPIYKSIDDPYLYVTSDKLKRHQMASLDSGRAAAQTMVSMYPDFFTQIWTDPLPDSFRDPHLGYKFTKLSEEALLERISKRAVQDAIKMYTDLKKAKTELSQETQEKLLELLTVFNCADPLTSSDRTSSDLSCYINNVELSQIYPFPVNSWKKGNMAEQVFDSLPVKTQKAYCYMIRGMAENNNKEGALDLYNEMKSLQMTADVYTYNYLLRLASLEVENMDDVKQLVEYLLRDMAERNVRPNVGTFNSVLNNCHRLSRWLGSKKLALSVLAEMKACGIEPTLATFTQIFCIFYFPKDQGKKTASLLENMLDNLEGKEFKCTEEQDVVFYRTAMKSIVTHFPDPKYALQLYKSVQTGRNSELLGHRQLQYAFYMDLFMVITPLAHIDTVMEIFSRVVPFIFCPSKEVFVALFESIQVHDAYGYIPQLYAELQNTTLFSEEDFCTNFTSLLSKQKFEPKLQDQICFIAQSIVHKWVEELGNTMIRRPWCIDGASVGNLIITFLNGGQTENAKQLFQLYEDNVQQVWNSPSEISLTMLAEELITQKDLKTIKAILDQLHNLNSDSLRPLVEKVLRSFVLSEKDRNSLQHLAEADSRSSVKAN